MNYAVPLLLLLGTLGLPPDAHGQEAEEPAATFYSTATVRERPLSSATGTVSVLDIATATVTKTFKAGTGIETLTYY